MSGGSRHIERIGGRGYDVEVYRRTTGSPDVSLIMASHNAKELTRVAIESVRSFARGDYELWVVDNASTDGTAEHLLAQLDVNVVLNRTPAWRDRLSWLGRFGMRRRRSGASYSNAIALELGACYARGRYLFVMHNDVLVCDENWLPFVLSKANDQVRGVAMSADPSRVHAMHQSGFLVDLALFRELEMTFLPALPAYDVGDAVTLSLRRHGFAYYVCANTFNRPETVAWIPESHPLRSLYCDRVFDDDGRVIFAHLGRGTAKTAGTYQQVGKTYPRDWIAFAERSLLARPRAGPVQ